MIASERFAKIVQILNDNGFISTKELAQRLSVTETTIRRDCEELEKRGLLIRVHGGAKSIEQKEILSNKDDKKMSERVDIYHVEKDLVCQKAASFIKDGDCIFLDGGTTIAHLLKYIKNKKIKIVTNNILIANEFEENLNSELLMIGGKYVSKYNMCVGPVALNDLERFNFDYAFLSCSGLDLERQLIYTTELDTMAIKQKAMELAIKKYMLIDSSKIFIKGFCSFIGLHDFDAIICDMNEKINEEELPHNFILVEKNIS